MTIIPRSVKQHTISLAINLVLALLLASQGYAKTVWNHCIPASSDNASGNTHNVITRDPVKDAVYVEANDGVIRQDNTSRLQGNVIIQQNDIRLNANSATYNHPESRIQAKGKVIFSSSTATLNADSIDYNLSTDSGILKNSEYTFGEYGARGHSTVIEQINKNELILNQANYTTCPKQVESWKLSSGKLHLNRQTQIGTARNVTFKVGKLPVFYFPWFSFPLKDQRLSGFLSPSIRISESIGTAFHLPYYFNLAPNYDYTLTPVILSKRGLMLGNEFRYLGQKHRGTIQYDILTSDNEYQGQHRDYFNLRHVTQLRENTRLTLNAEGVSDKDYFDDLGSSLETSSISSLPRTLSIENKQGNWQFSAGLKDYQVLDSTDIPYSKLPELRARYLPRKNPDKLHITIDNELSYFERENSATGSRADLQLNLSRHWQKPFGYFEPSLKIHHTSYALEDNPGGNKLSRTLPSLSLDAGLFLDRQTNWKSLTQTLEPRLFYSYTPYKDQSGFPVFDSSETDYSTSNQLFTTNRFTGKDRVGDTNKLTFAVTSRLQDRKVGKELLNLSLGNIFHFNDRRVTLPGGAAQTYNRSEIVLAMTAKPTDELRISTHSAFNTVGNLSNSHGLRINYQNKKRQILNFNYRKLTNELEESGLSFASPINNQWNIVAGYQHDIKNQRDLESVLGLEYKDCCWKTRIVGRRFLQSDNVNYDNALFIEFELKGLGNIGTSSSRLLNEKIYGYNTSINTDDL